MDKVWSMMHSMEVPDKSWEYAVSTATHIRNLTPSAVLDWQTSRETWDSKKTEFQPPESVPLYGRNMCWKLAAQGWTLGPKSVSYWDTPATGETTGSMTFWQGRM